MIYLFCVYFLVIVSAIIVIARTYHWLSIQRVNQMYVTPKIIIEHHNFKVHDYYDQIHYTNNIRDWYAQGWNPKGVPDVIKAEMIDGFKKQKAMEIGKSLLRDGFFEIFETEDHIYPLNIIHLKLRVLKPE